MIAGIKVPMIAFESGSGYLRAFCYNLLNRPIIRTDVMRVKYKGSIHFANGEPAAGVTVRIFDQDAPSKQDDDLTVEPGLSDERGRFQITYEPLRFMDLHTLGNS